MADLTGDISFTVKFELGATPTLKLVATSSISSGDKPNLTGYYSIKQPDGVVVTGNYTNPDIEWDAINGDFGSHSVLLRLANDGLYQRGEYEITMHAKCATYTDGEFSRKFTINFEQPSLELEHSFDCFTPLLSSEDITDYDRLGYTKTAQTRAWVSTSNIGVLNGSSASINHVHSANYYDSLYTIALTVAAEWQHSLDTWLTVSYNGSITEEKAAYIPDSMAVMAGYISLVEDSEECGCDTGLYDKAVELYGQIRALVCAVVITDLESLFDEFYRLTHNGEPKEYTNTDGVISVYDFVTGCSSAVTPPSSTMVIAECIAGQTLVVSGTSYAVNGMTSGSSVVSSTAFINKRVTVVRGSLTLPSIDPGDGSAFFTQTLATGQIVLNFPLSPGEYSRIQTIL